jgi:hypothetical protein
MVFYSILNITVSIRAHGFIDVFIKLGLDNF